MSSDFLLKPFHQPLTEAIITAAVNYVKIPIPQGFWRWIEISVNNQTRPRVYSIARIFEATNDRVTHLIGLKIQKSGPEDVKIISSQFFRVAEVSYLRIDSEKAQDSDVISYAVSGAYWPLKAGGFK